ncbi:DNA-3-methyladenine glycosylase I [Nocardioides sp. GY 10127]|uniref:DNA-3-methyladenine glycosylase I n=1 Tax=Nocardioides sp. GY 10127 TaxID=2569762 RepID=UPI0010A85496|nr:DNA-3-methyladenine glycosylase I [Nocardioides sp. GY 10127]TIC79969.1 DNA-3-methyladenine glycosylase I [Nocardioides sp. GY 10127]
MGPITGEDGVARCPWAGGPGPMRDYHDHEWGHPVHGEAAHLERLVLEGFQAGLSWSTILTKRERFREVFSGFEAETVAALTDDDVERLMADPGIVRNRAKIEAARRNAAATIALRGEGGLEAMLRAYAPTDSPAPATTEELGTTSPESTALSKALKKKGFAFVGPTTMYALMEALGLFDPHLVGCHARGSAS